ncbi:THUMP domain-containing class I SAM-dependent RNA methyltransferase [Gloeobacter kilaueensis]|uniref:23S rRNA m(2)G2445 methyltransferase n=1 Tax=Gloeobacter kilaueensis (strain ATCC BAA-2537 / CCAP 1431/1 / ULC 316 / JS1) TaxID=1183438 RepID=U5QSR7_GLOK1|nr:THUMP domain-containing protein [Gloeobacter kilaueensis]AGY60719.1 23S rRNA m(2)G2445 methyltransferase [Gloeobacter kilaueensis JS1]
MQKYFATVARSLEAVAAAELEKLGASHIEPGFAGVSFSGDLEMLYRVNLWARTIFRVLVPIAEFRATTREELYRQVRRIDWQPYLDTSATFAVDVTGSNAQLNHSHFTALQIKNAIVDQQRERDARRSSVDLLRPDLRLNAHIYQDRCILSLDSSGGSLHKRGYRPAMGIAPLKETLAAALIDLCGWDPALPFVDPLCGSGTLPIEAAIKALDIAPGLGRDRFGFEGWPGFDRPLWQRLQSEAKARRHERPRAPIAGSDHDRAVLQLAKDNARRGGLKAAIHWQVRELAQLEAPAPQGVLVCNPPYGERLGEASALGSLYRTIGDVFKQRFKGWTAFVLTANRELAKQIGLRPAQRLPIFNGALPCTFLKYELY